jgi:replicative DNA helicase
MLDPENKNETKLVLDVLNKNYEDIENTSLGNKEQGIQSGFYDFDALTQGLNRGDLIVLGGRPAMGKTSISLNIALNISERNSFPVCIFSLEMSKEQITYRLMSMDSGIESGRLRTGRLQQDEWPVLAKSIENIGRRKIYINDKSTISIKEIQDICLTIKKQAKNKKLGLVVIDFVQLMELEQNSSDLSRDDELTKIAIKLKKLAVELNVPVIVTSQLERVIERRINKRPMLSDIRDTSALEGFADIITMIYRDEYYDPETEDRGITELITCKHRNGPVGTVKLLFEPQFTRFRNLAA